MSATLTKTERRTLVARRKKESLFWGLVHFFGSLRLAMFLLVTISIACAVATFLESGFNAVVARAYIYKAPWFIFWLALLCVNLAAAALTRWPWERKHVGFVTTHLGIITLLIGAMIGQKTGFEASVNLRKGEPATNRLVLNETVLQIENVADGSLYSMPFPVEVRRPTPERPREVRLPGGGGTLVVSDYAQHLDTVRELVVAPDGAGKPSIELELESGMMGQRLPVRLLTGDAERHDLFGLAMIGLDTPENQPPVATRERAVRESVVALSKMPASPVVVPRQGFQASGCAVTLFEWEGKFYLEIRFPEGGSGRGEVRPHSAFTVEGPGGRVEVTMHEFWPTFALQEGRPASLGDRPENPAVRLDLEGTVREPEGRPQPRLLLRVLPEEGKVAWRSLRGAQEVAAGSEGVGGRIVTGWADWQARVVAVHPSARFEERLRPIPAESLMPGSRENPPPGIRARLVDPAGVSGPDRWIVSGRSESLTAGSAVVQVGFGLLTKRIPFLVGLDRFEVPRDEGTDTPANFISTLRFEEPARGIVRQGVSKMNHPASYPGGLGPVLTGINYKFSQASWNPENLDETTLQVLYDPGWLLKWVGSLMICCGIAIMFYLRPKPAGGGSVAAPSPSLP